MLPVGTAGMAHKAFNIALAEEMLADRRKRSASKMSASQVQVRRPPISLPLCPGLSSPSRCPCPQTPTPVPLAQAEMEELKKAVRGVIQCCIDTSIGTEEVCGRGSPLPPAAPRCAKNHVIPCGFQMGRPGWEIGAGVLIAADLSATAERRRLHRSRGFICWD